VRGGIGVRRQPGRKNAAAAVILPDFPAGPDGFFRFGRSLADAASLLVTLEVADRSGIRASEADREIWHEPANDVVRPEYDAPHTAEQMAPVEQAMRNFIAGTATNYLQVCKMREWRDLRRGRPQG